MKSSLCYPLVKPCQRKDTDDRGDYRTDYLLYGDWGGRSREEIFTAENHRSEDGWDSE